ncbi:MAG: hypothetical protein U0935_00810 [Pirellulales bacterium]
MSNGNGQAAAHEATQAVLRPWLDFWTQMFEQRSDWMQVLMAGSPAQVDVQTLRKRWLDALTRSIDAYVRTPAFLESMRKNFDAMTALKTSSELAKRELSRQAGMPYVEDIAGLYERLQTSHEVVLARLTALDERLAAIERRLADGTPRATPGEGADS